MINFSGETKTRGNTCGVVNLGSNSASAHCLAFDKSVTFKSYIMGSPRLTYEIKIDIGVPVEGGEYTI